MTCEVFQEQFVEYFLGELPSDAARALERHLQSGCEACNREFRELRDGTDLLFSIAPQAELSQYQRDAIFHNAVSVDWPAKLAAATESSQAVRDRKRGRSADYRYGLLALVAGFILVVLAPTKPEPQPAGSSLAHQQLGPALTGQQARSTDKLKFVAFKDVSPNSAAPPNHPQAQHQLLGFLLVDARAQEIHLLGRLAQPELANVPRFELLIVTASGTTVHPLSLDSQGACRALVPLPAEPVVNIELRSQSPESSKVVS